MIFVNSLKLIKLVWSSALALYALACESLGLLQSWVECGSLKIPAHASEEHLVKLREYT